MGDPSGAEEETTNVHAKWVCSYRFKPVLSFLTYPNGLEHAIWIYAGCAL